jgi:hypothetical protein
MLSVVILGNTFDYCYAGHHYAERPDAVFTTHHFLSLTSGSNKLECLTLASFSVLV